MSLRCTGIIQYVKMLLISARLFTAWKPKKPHKGSIEQHQDMASCNDPAMRASYSCMALRFDVTVLLEMLTNYIAEAETMP